MPRPSEPWARRKVAALQAGTTGDPLLSWREGASKQAILDLVQRGTANGGDAMLPEERVTVFDYDGTLWCEKPIRLDFAFSMTACRHVIADGMAAR
jgi:hypothetical protein